MALNMKEALLINTETDLFIIEANARSGEFYCSINYILKRERRCMVTCLGKDSLILNIVILIEKVKVVQHPRLGLSLILC